MEYTTLGDTGLSVSRICLGCNSIGGGLEWNLDDEASRELIDRAIELGINFFDTANTYSDGHSERVLGTALSAYDRDWPVVATKVYFPTDEDNLNAGGLAPKTIEQELSNSLNRLGMDTVDLYQIHRWDDDTPIHETLRALDDAVRRGQVRYLGASTTRAHEFAASLWASDRLGLERFVTMQNHYNLVYREDERELLPLCAREGIGIIPWSPLARGYLCRPDEALRETRRGRTDDLLDERLGVYRGGGGVTVNERVAELAAEYEASMAQIAIAWLLTKVDAPIVGTTSIDHLEEAVAAVDIDLDPSDIEWLEAPYEPVPVTPPI